LSIPGRQIPPAAGGQPRKICGREVGQIQERLPMERVLNLDSAEFNDRYFDKITKPISSESALKTSYDYMLVYISTTKDVAKRRGDPVEDLKDGIYHFNIGSDMGLLKKMNFKRNPIPFMAEMRSEQAERDGVDSLQQLKFPYNTDLTLIGTSLFIPGMWCYINPSFAGLGSIENSRSLAYYMNLGGYHVILKTTTTIAAGRYETTLEGWQQ
jgi:hypothetical protein